MQKPVPPVFPEVQVIREDYKFFDDDDPPPIVLWGCMVGMLVLSLIKVLS
ncbi:hypothetical protein pEaSNUABM8_00185 [Erwinia phage pEa_SNUABM_8]|nr:hypothetical protein pEaSNUABM8_00185 [Erwinia phage pEa_SNUABM_8]QVW54937.1 hypothetical protein pEaSNUABM4_00184 [Erwinia phage pEa_SNUABM_4]